MQPDAEEVSLPIIQAEEDTHQVEEDASLSSEVSQDSEESTPLSEDL